MTSHPVALVVAQNTSKSLRKRRSSGLILVPIANYIVSSVLAKTGLKLQFSRVISSLFENERMTHGGVMAEQTMATSNIPEVTLSLDDIDVAILSKPYENDAAAALGGDYSVEE